MPVLKTVTAPYTRAEGWFYDRVVAPAIMQFGNAIDEHLIQHLPPDGELLDVGCGGGHMAAHVAESIGGLRIVGLDLAAHQIQRARKRAAKFGDRVKFVEGSALEIPFEDNRFDAVLSIASIKHWPDRARGVAECVRVLKPGGRLGIADADRGCAYGDAKNFANSWRIPSLIKPIALPVFRTYIAGQSIDLLEGRSLLDSLNVENVDVRRIPGSPGLMMLALKRMQ